MTEIELWESEIEDSNKSHYFENILESINILTESLDADLRLVNEGVLLESNMIGTLKKKVRELIKKFKIFVKKLAAKVRSFIQKKIRTPEDKIYNKLSERISNINSTDYKGDEYRQYADKFNKYLEKNLDRFKERGTYGEHYPFYFISKNGKVYSDLEDITDRIRYVQGDYDIDKHGRNSRGSTAVALGYGKYMANDTYVSRDDWYDSKIDLDRLWILYDFPDKTTCDTIKEIMDKSEENVGEAYKVLELIDTKFVDDLFKLENDVSKSDMSDEENLNAYKTAITNIKDTIKDTKDVLTNILDRSLSQDMTIVKIRHEFIVTYNKLI